MKENNGKWNRGLIDKKAYEDQLVPFVSLVLEISHYYLSIILLDTQSVLGEIKHCVKEDEIKESNDKERKGKQG